MIYGVISIGLAVIIILGGRKKSVHTYNAHFGSDYEHLSRLNLGVAVTGHKAITRSQSMTNIALFGPTGSGKSSTVIISSAVSIARGKSSVVFNDVSGEIYQRTSGYLAQKGYLILRIDFSDATHSESFNPLLECKTISDIQKVALLIIHNAMGESKTEIFWEQSSIMLLSLFIRYLVFYADVQYRTLQNVLRLLEKFATDTEHEIDQMFIKTDPELISSYKAMLVVGDKTLQSIIISTRVALNLWNDKEVCKTTATHTIDFGMLRNPDFPVAIFVCNPLQHLIYFRPLSALFFQSLFNFILSRIPDKDERSIFILLDEFATMKFPAMSTTISNIRKFNSSLTLCMQDEIALISKYGQSEAHQIKTNCGCQIYLPGQPLHTCRELSHILGKYTVIDEETGKEKGVRELMSVDELRMANEAIILINNSAPLRSKTLPYYKNFWLRKLSSLPPHPLQVKNIIEPPLIPFK